MIHIYSGDGKGKTSAAVGLAVRGAGAGLRVAFFQFLKDGSSSEIAVLKEIKGITVRCCEGCRKFIFEMSEEEKAAVIEEHNRMLSEICSVIEGHEADIIVLDEFFDAYNTGFFDRLTAEDIVTQRSGSIELVLTGRDPAALFCGIADYHSEILSVRHPYNKGAPARKGIEF